MCYTDNDRPPLPPGGAPGTCNIYSGVAISGTSPLEEIGFSYFRNSGANSPIGFKVDGGAIKSAKSVAGPPTCGGAVTVPTANWQELTDPRTLKVTEFEITPVPGPDVQVPCPKLCSDGTQNCWPTTSVRNIEIKITGEAVHDASVVRTIRTTVRLRNDRLQFNDAANPTQICPT